MPRILFICTANQCRSPMAQVIFEEKLRQQGITAEWKVDSAATWGRSGVPASQGAQEMAAEHALDLVDHRSTSVDELDLTQFDLILVMETNHQEALRTEQPELADRIQLLADMSGQSFDVPDPIGGDRDAYRQTWRLIEDLIERGFGTIQKQLAADNQQQTANND